VTRSKDMDTNNAVWIKETGIQGDVIRTDVIYLVKDPKHENEKPYDLRYDTGGIIPSTNMENDSKPVIVRDIRPFQNPQMFEEYGFSLAKMDYIFTAAELQDKKTVEETYYPAIKKILRQKFPDATEIKILEHAVRMH
jgi:hypothetical protein